MKTMPMNRVLSSPLSAAIFRPLPPKKKQENPSQFRYAAPGKYPDAVRWNPPNSRVGSEAHRPEIEIEIEIERGPSVISIPRGSALRSSLRRPLLLLYPLVSLGLRALHFS